MNMTRSVHNSHNSYFQVKQMRLFLPVTHYKNKTCSHLQGDPQGAESAREDMIWEGHHHLHWAAKPKRVIVMKVVYALKNAKGPPSQASVA